eukprot:scaffold22345_cov43-Attheya_sp.AAC.4
MYIWTGADQHLKNLVATPATWGLVIEHMPNKGWFWGKTPPVKADRDEEDEKGMEDIPDLPDLPDVQFENGSDDAVQIKLTELWEHVAAIREHFISRLEHVETELKDAHLQNAALMGLMAVASHNQHFLYRGIN